MCTNYIIKPCVGYTEFNYSNSKEIDFKRLIVTVPDKHTVYILSEGHFPPPK